MGTSDSVKIYISTINVGDNHYYVDSLPDGDVDKKHEVEFIRKDFLLEWLEAKVYEHNEDKFDDGFNTALGQVIDKINSL